MKKILPLIFYLILGLAFFVNSVNVVYADDIPFPSPSVPYSEDPEVNFVGKTAARAVQFLNWTLQNYEWSCYVKYDASGNIIRPPSTDTTNSTNTRICSNNENPLIGFWITIRNIVYAFFALIVLITAFVLMATRGKSLTLKRFLPRFIAVVLLVTLSYSLIQIIYTTVDVIQGFFLTQPGTPRRLISAQDLLYVGWDYEYFRGLRKVHPFFDESVFVNLLLARLTAVTYYAMTGVLIIRKIILWFFIVLSPVFPILLLYYPVRNTAKIWIGEFFRWLLYAPLFTIFLSGLVSIWKSPRLPLIFDFKNVGTSFVYPTATNVLLGGPGQIVTADNNLNTPDTFALYVVALIMLWVVILLPFILLQIFLDYLNNFSFEESPAMQKLINTSYLLLNKAPPAPVPLPPSAGTGLAKQLPFAKYSDAKNIPVIKEGPIGDAMQLPKAMPIGVAREIPITRPQASTVASVHNQLLTATNISLPTIRDIATYEKDLISNRDSSNISKTYQTLAQIANPSTIQNEIEREKFIQLKDRLIKESTSGNTAASSILSAVNIASNISNVTNQNINQIKNLKKTLTNISNPQSVTAGVDRERMTMLRDSLVKESEKGNTLATTILAAKENTTVRELQNIKNQLTRESITGNNVSTSLVATSFTKEHESVLKNVLKEIANPASAMGSDRERISELHNSLVKESEKGNTLATSILSTKETSTSNEIHDLKEKLIEATLQGNHEASTILTTAIGRIDASTTQKVMQQLANPTSITSTAVKEKYEKVKDKLILAQSQGNQFAASMLTKMQGTSQEDANSLAPVNTKEMELVKTQLLDAKTKGEPLADDVLGLFASEEGGITDGIVTPSTNRIQTVSLEDYEAVRKMWQENYKDMEVPEGLSSRKEWISDDVRDIDNILSLLTSGDNEKIQQGMEEVGNVLPFLLLGGFSQDEIVSYLKAKQEAGKSVIDEIGTEEDTLVTVETHTTTKTSMTQSATIDDESDDNTSAESPLSSSPSVKVNTELLTLTNLPIPTIKDVVRFEMSSLSNDPIAQEEVIKVKETLARIANPEVVTDVNEKTRINSIKDNLSELSGKGDVHAGLILSASNAVNQKNDNHESAMDAFHRYLMELSHPDLYAVKDIESIKAVSEMLANEVKKQNILADRILMITADTPLEQIADLKEEVKNEAEAGNILAVKIWELAPKDENINTVGVQSIELPASNPLQTVNIQDYEAVRGMWEDYYRKSNSPVETMDKRSWLNKESDTIRSTLMLLSSHDNLKVQEGLRQVSLLLPFVLLGGFSLDEITSYLDAKLHAANSLLESQSEEGEKVLVDRAVEKAPENQSKLAQSIENDENTQSNN